MKLSMDQYNALMSEAADKLVELQNEKAALLARSSQDAETIKALEAQIATKDAALKVALMWSDADWVGHEIVTAALAGSAS